MFLGSSVVGRYAFSPCLRLMEVYEESRPNCLSLNVVTKQRWEYNVIDLSNSVILQLHLTGDHMHTYLE